MSPRNFRMRPPVNIFAPIDDMEYAFRKDPLGAENVVTRRYDWRTPIYDLIKEELKYNVGTQV